MERLATSFHAMRSSRREVTRFSLTVGQNTGGAMLSTAALSQFDENCGSPGARQPSTHPCHTIIIVTISRVSSALNTTRSLQAIPPPLKAGIRDDPVIHQRPLRDTSLPRK